MATATLSDDATVDAPLEDPFAVIGSANHDHVAPSAGPITVVGPGSHIGPYKLLQQIGEGGMGAVFMAEQEAPVRRRVAVKVIKPGMASKQFVARFEAERQALALMDHPHIARVLDAGATDTGVPYFVMELVKGVPITTYCDQARLTPRQRLELFVSVCQAIQHAHQKGIIHRDIKPSNVLVTLNDGKPLPKVIDFGVAKAIDNRLTDRTLFTQFGAVIGTLEYMSPEQAETSGLDIDTRSDLYSLGILLYELLTGSTPIPTSTMKQATFGEILRRIREEEPPRPSARLSMTEELAAVATCRNTEPGRLSPLIRGELDWIVMKALEKDRSRRYATVNSLARDVERYLAGDPLEAGPPSIGYRLGKLARKYQGLLLTAAAFTGLLILAAVLGTSLAIRAFRAEAQARQRLVEVQRADDETRTAQAATERALEETRKAQAATERALEETRTAQGATERALSDSEANRRQTEAVNTFLIDVLRSPELGVMGGEFKGADVLDRALAKLDARFQGTPGVKGDLYSALGQTYYSLRLYDKAAAVHEKALDLRQANLGRDHPATLASMNWLALTYLNLRRTASAISLLEETLKLRKERLGPNDPATLATMSNLANAYRTAGRMADAIALHQEAIEQLKASSGPDHPHTLASMNNLALDYRQDGRLDEAIKLGEQVLERRRARLPRNDPDTLGSMHNLAVSYRSAERLDDAIRLFEETVRLRKEKLGSNHRDTLSTMSNLARAYVAAKRFGDADNLYGEILRIQRRDLPADGLALADTLDNLGDCLLRAGKAAEAEPPLRESLGIREKQEPDDWRTFNTRSLLGDCLLGQKKYSDSEPLLLSGYNELKARVASIPPQSRNRVTQASKRIVRLYLAWGKPEQAKEWRTRLSAPTREARPEP
jgi:serine/threonine protein kinase